MATEPFNQISQSLAGFIDVISNQVVMVFNPNEVRNALQIGEQILCIVNLDSVHHAFCLASSLEKMSLAAIK
jgi:hypothetical protein